MMSKLKKDYMGRGLDCPRDFTRMEQEEVEVIGRNVTVDVCPKCGGMWLDTGELKKIIGDKSLTDYLTKDIGTKTQSKLVCPRCGGLMDLEKAEDVEVDVCLTCHGVWLDAGELEDLKETSKAGFEGDMEAKEQERYEEYEKKERARRRGGFLSGIFGR